MSPVTVHFADDSHPPVTVPDRCELASHLDIHNSPVLFGCRTGICGICAAVVEGAHPPADEAEREVLDIEWPREPGARLLCQLRPTSDLTIRKVLG